MFRPLFFVLLLVAVVAAFTEECGPNEEWTKCWSSGPPGCKENVCGIWPNPRKICHLDCNPGCVCKKGYYRHEAGYCVDFRGCFDPR